MCVVHHDLPDPILGVILCFYHEHFQHFDCQLEVQWPCIFCTTMVIHNDIHILSHQPTQYAWDQLWTCNTHLPVLSLPASSHPLISIDISSVTTICLAVICPSPPSCVNWPPRSFTPPTLQYSQAIGEIFSHMSPNQAPKIQNKMLTGHFSHTHIPGDYWQTYWHLHQQYIRCPITSLLDYGT